MKILTIFAITAAAVAMCSVAVASATTLEVNGTAKTSSITVKLTLVSGGSLVLSDGFGTTDTCTGSEIEFSTQSPFTGAPVQGPASVLSFSGCTHTTHVIKPGKISIIWTGGTNGDVYSIDGEWTIVSTVFGVTATCKTGASTKLGTITGVSGEGEATVHVNATIGCGILGNVKMAGGYRATKPRGLGVVS
jgi:hypothetical protein